MIDLGICVALCSSLAAVIVDLPLCLQQFKMIRLEWDSKKFHCQGSALNWSSSSAHSAG